MAYAMRVATTPLQETTKGSPTMKGFDFKYERAAAFINGTFYVKQRNASVKVTTRSRKKGTETTSFCHALMRV